MPRYPDNNTAQSEHPKGEMYIMRMYLILLAVSFVFFTVVGCMTGTVNSVESFLNALPLIGPVIEGKGILGNFHEGLLVFAITVFITKYHSSGTFLGRFIERFITACISAIIVGVIRICAGMFVVQVLAAIVFSGSILWFFIDRGGAVEYWKSFLISIVSYVIVLEVIAEIVKK